ncbi:uncharacterized protein [Miscanthus floridulus]|uniref:uncharacterized protein n=1 Tax=Miscanthus floridulus TaxID=154761 RepID=UPI00345AC234
MVLTQQQQTQSESGSPSERPTALATEQEEELATATAAPAAATASTAEAELSGGSGSKATVGAKRRARARQLGELNVPTAAFDLSISKSGSLPDWLRQGGQIFSPSSYVTPRFGTSPPAERRGGAADEQQQQQALLDPELVAQFERAMEQLSKDEGRAAHPPAMPRRPPSGTRRAANSHGCSARQAAAPTATPASPRPPRREPAGHASPIGICERGVARATVAPMQGCRSAMTGGRGRRGPPSRVCRSAMAGGRRGARPRRCSAAGLLSAQQIATKRTSG